MANNNNNNQRNVFDMFNDAGDLHNDDMVISDDELEIIDYGEIPIVDILKQKEQREKENDIDQETYLQGIKKYEEAHKKEMCMHCGLYKPENNHNTGFSSYKQLYSKYRRLREENKDLYIILNEFTEKMVDMNNKMSDMENKIKNYERFSQLVILQEYDRHTNENAGDDVFEFREYDSPISPEKPDSTSFINLYNYGCI